MPYSNISSVPKALITAGLTLAQANAWAAYYDAAKGDPKVTSAAAVAWTMFKKKYYKLGNKWKLKKQFKGEKKMKKEKAEFKGYELVYRSSPSPVLMEDIEAEGKTYVKELIREGEWAHPQRPSVKLRITRNRLQGWVENFNKNLFKVPVPKRHSLDPEDNRGWLKKVFIQEDQSGNAVLYGHLDITNNKMQELIDNGDVQDVSVSVGEYMDNKGKRHGEALQHVALTVIPHIDGQSGFTPINNEGYMCFEEIGYIQNMEDKIKNGEVFEEKPEQEVSAEVVESPEGSAERHKEDVAKAIITAKLFPEPSMFNIVGTYMTKVIVQYYGGGAGSDGTPTVDRFFQIPYTRDLNGKYVFGDKVELVKKYYFITRDINPMLEKKEEQVLETEKKQKGVKDMKEFEAMKAEKEQLETAKAELEAKVAELEPKVTELETKITDLEKVVGEKDAVLQEIEAEKKAAFEAGITDKVEKMVEGGYITPADKEDVKVVMLEGGKAAETLEKTIMSRKVVDLEKKTKENNKKPTVDNEMTPDKAKAEAERIMGKKQ